MRRNWRFVTFWILGSIAILLGAMIAGNVQIGVGVSENAFLIALLIAFLLILVGGLLWISVALAMKKVFED